jgi:hypothetical protein
MVNLAFSKRTLCWEEFWRAKAKLTRAASPMTKAIGIKDPVGLPEILSSFIVTPPPGVHFTHP